MSKDRLDAKDSRYARNTESGYKRMDSIPGDELTFQKHWSLVVTCLWLAEQLYLFDLQITFSLGCMLAMSACFWFYVQDINGRNAVYVTAVIMGCGGSVMLVTSLSLIAELIGHDKVT